jgi:hypothetical protein
LSSVVEQPQTTKKHGGRQPGRALRYAKRLRARPLTPSPEALPEFAVSLDETTVSRELKKLGYVKLTARPRHHAHDTDALEAFKKGASQPSLKRCAQAYRKAPQ